MSAPDRSEGGGAEGEALDPRAPTEQGATHTILGVGSPTPPLVPKSLPPDRLVPGTELEGRYCVVDRLGEGGMAIVYRGLHTTIQKPVALKVLRAEYAARPDPVARFLQEARAASKIRQPNVVEISDFGETQDGLVFCVMEFLEGEDLAETCVREGALPWPRVCRMGVQICAALAAAHDVGVVHRDLKPENIFRIKQGRDNDFIKVLDFGIAHVARDPGDSMSDGRRPQTKVGLIAGTPSYMSPEQARGAKVDSRTDIYALGAMLFELLTGQVPFEADSAAEILAMQLHAAVPDPRGLVPDLPDRLAELVMRCLAKDRDERFASMGEVSDELEALYAESIVGHDDPSEPAVISGLTGTLRPTPRPHLSKAVTDAELKVETSPEVAFGDGEATDERGVAWLPWAIVALLLVGGGAWWMSRGGDNDRAGAVAAAAGADAGAVEKSGDGAAAGADAVGGGDAANAGAAAGSGAAGSDGGGSGGSAGVVEDAAPTVTVRFSTNVVADVFDEAGEWIGSTEGAEGIVLPQGAEPVKLTLRRDGYRDEAVTVSAAENAVVQVDLRKDRKRGGKSGKRGGDKSGKPAKSDDGGGDKPKDENKLSEVKNPFD